MMPVTKTTDSVFNVPFNRATHLSKAYTAKSRLKLTSTEDHKAPKGYLHWTERKQTHPHLTPTAMRSSILPIMPVQSIMLTRSIKIGQDNWPIY